VKIDFRSEISCKQERIFKKIVPGNLSKEDFILLNYGNLKLRKDI